MPLPWAVAFKLIPWSDVIAAAPDAVRAARKLWRETRQPAPGAAADAPTGAVTVQDEDARWNELDARTRESAELLTTLALQNQQLIDALDVLRQRIRWLSLACALLAIGFGVLWFRLD